jgi:O-antigen/teichoic acid export membrane protein
VGVTPATSPIAAGSAVSGRSRVAHNALLNFLGLAVPLGLAFFIVPIAAVNLGPARFGLLGLAWAITEYLTLFDLGLGRALVKFVADALHDASHTLSEIVASSMMAQLAAGLIGGSIVVVATPFLVHDVFKVQPSVAGEAVGVFRLVGASVPIVLLVSGQRAILEGAQRFDLSASLKMLGSIASLGIPAVGAVLGASLPAIMAWVLFSRLVVSVLYAIAIRRALPALRWVGFGDWGVMRRLASFGGWVLVSNTVSPLLVYFDRFALTTIAGLAATGFYTAPYEGVVRLLLIPVSLFSSLLPALTAIEAKRDRLRFMQVTSSSERVLAPVMALPLALVFVFASGILRAWLGAQYAAESATALRWLAVGVFANSLANPLFVTLYAKNRPDLPAKFHLFELVVHIPLTIYLIRTFGIAGAAAAWATRAALDLLLLLVATARLSGAPIPDIAGGRIIRTAMSILLLLAGFAIARALATTSTVAGVAVVLASSAAFAAAVWRWILEDIDRAAIAGTVGSYLRITPPVRRDGVAR